MKEEVARSCFCYWMRGLAWLTSFHFISLVPVLWNMLAAVAKVFPIRNKVGARMDGRMGGWVDGRMGGWVDGRNVEDKMDDIVLS